MTLLASALAMLPATRAQAQFAADASTGAIEIGGQGDSQCSITTGDPSIAGADGRYSTVIPVSIGCNTPFTLRGAAASGTYRAAAADGVTMTIAYDVVWPASLVDADDMPIAPAFTASGAAWRAGITAVSGATRERQIAPMIVRLRGTVAPGARIAPDIFMIDIEQN